MQEVDPLERFGPRTQPCTCRTVDRERPRAVRLPPRPVKCDGFALEFLAFVLFYLKNEFLFENPFSA